MDIKYQEALNHFKTGDLDLAEQILSAAKENENNPDVLFFRAVIKSKKREMDSAVKFYQATLKINPNHLEAAYNLALCYQNSDRNNDAIIYYQKALELNPFLSEAHNNLAIIYKNQNNFDKAEEHYHLALRSRPNNDNVIRNLAGLKKNKSEIYELKHVNELFDKGDFNSAETLLKSLCTKYPNNNEVLNALGTFYFHRNNIPEAIAAFSRIIDREPDNETAHYSLGVCYQNADDVNPALKHYSRCIELNPEHLDALNNIGLLYTSIKKYDEAEISFNKAIDINPSYFNAFTNKGNLLINQDKLEDADVCFLKALELANSENNIVNKSVTFSNLGFVKLRQKKLDEAIQLFDKAIELNQDSILAHYNKAETLLLSGKLEQAWKDYEYRTGRKDFGKRHFKRSPKTLDELQGKRILVYAEQGLGDAFQFIRYIPLLKREECYIIFECDKSIFGLLKNFPGIDELIERNLLEAPKIEYDYDIPLLSLPLLFNTSLNTIPSDVPYLTPDEELRSKWKRIIGDKYFKIGIVWAGNPIHSNDRHRSVKLSQFLNLFSIEGTRFFSLQKGFPLIQAKDYQLLLTNLDDYGISSFSDTAAILSNLDLLITVDTSVAHLAGAMGIPVWILLPNFPDWRWMLDRSDSPWYPSARLFRQPTLGDWDSVFGKLKKEILNIIHHKKKNFMKRDYTNLNHFLNKIESQVFNELPSPVRSQVSEMMLNKILEKYITETNLKILDIGCGKGHALELFRSKGCDPVGITINDEDAEACRCKGFNIYKMDQSFMNFEDNSFDFIRAVDVLQYSIMPLFTVSEYYRIAKDNAFVYIEVPVRDNDVCLTDNPNHINVFGKSTWISLFTKAGFIIADELTHSQGEDIYYGFVCKKSTRRELRKKIILGLSSGENFGWGVCSKYLKKHLSEKTDIVNLDENPELVKRGFVNGKIFHALTGDFDSLFPVKGDVNIGYTFFEYELSEKAISNAKNYDLILGGSSWNEFKLNERGINNTGVLIQGIDPELFYPGEKLKNNDLFVIFSGGKFELRKGQDLVLRAFKILHEKYPDIILINAWYNLWPETVKSMYQSRHIDFEYKGETWKNFMINLCRINSIDGSRVFTLPIIPNEKLRDVYLSSDIGLFPNRCEGGTNLVLMEYMACGKPVIASYTSGHKDILNAENSFPLKHMNEFRVVNSDGTLAALWEEPDLDEIIASIEYAYFNREHSKHVGIKAGEHLKNFTWEKAADNLLKIVN